MQLLQNDLFRHITTTLLSHLNGNIKKQDICKAEADLSSSGWYRIVTKTSGETDIDGYGGLGESGIIIISRLYSFVDNESYVILFNSAYNKHVVFRCVGASVNSQLIDKLRISLTSARSFNIELHYDSLYENRVSVTVIYNQCGEKWSSANLTQVTETVSDVAVYNIPTEDDVTKLTSDLGYVNCEVNTIANDSIAIPGAPNDARRIPIIIGHSSINNCLENISYINGWRIYSTVAQTTYIRFFKYPV